MNIHGLQVSSNIVSKTFYDWSVHFNTYALGAPASDDLPVFDKKEDMLFFHSI